MFLAEKLIIARLADRMLGWPTDENDARIIFRNHTGALDRHP
jgi:hypothetical protein